MIIYKRMGWKNFGPYGNEMQIVEFNDGLNLITGDNGAGKSFILEPLSFVLTRKPFRKDNTLTDIVNWTNVGDAEVWIEFSKGDTEYYVRRTMDDDELQINKAEITGFSSKTGFQKELEKITGVNHSVLKNIMVISADAMKAIPDMKLSEKRKLIEEYFDLKIIANMLALAKTRKSDKSSEIQIIQNHVQVTEVNIDNKVKYVESKKESLESALKYIDDQIQNLKEETDANVSNLEKEIVQADESIQNLKKKLADYSQEEEKFKKERDARLNNIRDKIGELESEMAVRVAEAEKLAEAKKEKISTTQKEIEDCFVKRKQAIKEEIEHLDSDLAEAELLEQRITSKIKEETELETEILSEGDPDEIIRENREKESNAQSRMAVIREKANEQKSLKSLLEAGGNCPMCNNEITDEHRKSEMARLVAERNNLKAEKASLDSVVAKAKEAIEQAENLKKRHSDVVKSMTSLGSELAKASSDIINLKEKIGNRKSELENPSDTPEIKLLKTSLESLQSDSGESIEAIKMGYMEKIATGREKLIQIESEKFENDSSPKQIEERISEYEKTKKDLKSEIETAKSSMKKKLEKFDADKKNHNLYAEIEEAEKDVENHRVMLKSESEKLTVSEHEHDILEKVVTALSDNGVKAYFIKQFIPMLNKTIARLLSTFSLPISVEFSENMSVTVTNYLSRKKSKYHQHSKGERKRIDFVVLLAFLENVMTILSNNSNIIIFDEFLDGGTDSKGMDGFIEMLSHFSKKNDLGVYIISHKVASDYFQERWYVEKHDGFSQIKVQE